MRLGLAETYFVTRVPFQIDHFWDAGAIARLDLEGIRLVVLSACNTGVGLEHDQNGISGLAEAFMRAGVRNVILTLWNIDDRATCEFMTYFYEVLFRHHRVRDAFATAKEKIMRHPTYHHPYYWAGFALYGLN